MVADMIAVVTMCPGLERYSKFLSPLVESLKAFFPPHDFFLFTEDSTICPEVMHVYQEDLGWPRTTLMRYSILLSRRYLFEGYSHIFWIDADTRAASAISADDICGNGITAVIHPGLIDTPEKIYERRAKSTAAIVGNKVYYQGAFQGGSNDAFFEMCEAIDRNVRIDDERGITARWLDESHLNRYLFDNPPAISLPPTYLTPADTTAYPCVQNKIPKIVHLWKDNQESWKGPMCGEQWRP